LVVSKLLEVLLKNLLLATVISAWHEPAKLLKHLLLIMWEVVLDLGVLLGIVAVKELSLGRLVEWLLHLLMLLNASVAV
jgi:hypothetical protein